MRLAGFKKGNYLGNSSRACAAVVVESPQAVGIQSPEAVVVESPQGIVVESIEAQCPKIEYRRLSIEEHERMLKSPIKCEESFSTSSQQTMFLRPKKHCGGQLDSLAHGDTAGVHVESTGNRIVDLPTMVRAYHSAMMAHQEFKKSCVGLLISLSTLEVKVGLGTKVVFGCTLCNFRSELLPLYRAVNQCNKPGRDPCELNIALQLGLHQTSISTSAVRRLFSSLSLPCPSVTTLQSSANSFGPKMERINESDMAEKRGIIKDTLKLRGLPEDSPICAEYDRQYNNPLRNARSKTPFAPATQCRDVIVENVTTDKFVIGYHHSNKLCLIGQMRRRQGEKVECPGHEGCTANLGASENIGDEKRGGEQCASKLLSGRNPIKVKYLTTDADGKACKGFSSVMSEATETVTENLLDQVHLNRSLRKALTNAVFSPNMFPAKVKAEKSLIQKRFAEDVSYRVQAEVTACRKALKNDHAKCVKRMSECLDCLIKCYSGDHSHCSKLSFICNSGQRRYRFPFMPRISKGSLLISEADSFKLKNILQVRTCSKTLWSTRMKSSTQKAEAVNSAFKVTNPKHSTTFARNSRYRDHSAIHLTNNGPGESIVKKMEGVGLQLTSNSPCVPALKQMQRKQIYDKFRRKCKRVRSRRARLRESKYKLHETVKYGTVPTSEYKKDQLIQNDHSYSRRASLSKEMQGDNNYYWY